MKVVHQYNLAMILGNVGAVLCFVWLFSYDHRLAGAFVAALVMRVGFQHANELYEIHGRAACEEDPKPREKTL